MNRGELVSYVIDKVGQTDPEDIASCQKYLSKRYEMIWNQFLWKDSLIGCDVSVDPTNADNAEGIILCPSMIDRVVAVRTPSNAVRIHGMEEYYAIDYDKFTKQGQAYEFALLSPIWFKWRGYSGLRVVFSSSSDASTKVKITWRDDSGRRFVQLLGNGDFLTSTAPAEDQSKVNVSGAGTVETNGLYTSAIPPEGSGQLARFLRGATDQSDFWMYIGTPQNQWILRDVVGNQFYFRVNQGGPPVYPDWSNDSSTGATPAPSVNWGQLAKIEVESVFKPVTVGDVSFVPQISNDPAVSYLLATTETASPKYQRIRLVGKPSQPVTLSILGKKKASALDFDQEEPELRNIDNVLIAFTEADMLQKQRQYGKAQAKMQEGAVLLQELAKIETIQAANNSHFMPTAGMGDAYFGPSLGYEYGL